MQYKHVYFFIFNLIIFYEKEEKYCPVEEVIFVGK